MKTLALCLVLLFCANGLFAQNITVHVVNPASFDRTNETIEVQWSDFKEAINLSDSKLIGVYEEDKNIPCQTIDADENGTPELLVFQSSFKGDEEKDFSIRSLETAPEPQFVSLAKFMVPREDVAWENDRMAYRIYGGPKAGDVRSGVDVLVKSVAYPVLDKWYHGDSLKGKERVSYHTDHGEGADFFSVGKTLGGGGCALWNKDNYVISGLFTSHKILASGPVRAMFKVWYEKDTLDGTPFVEERTITFDAGSNLNKIEVRFTGLPETAAESVAVGLVKRKQVVFSSDEKQGWFSMWGLANDDSTNGDLSTGVVFPVTGHSRLVETNDHYLMIGYMPQGSGLTYYAGGGWSKSGNFPVEQNWKDYLNNYSQRVQHPLKVSVLTK